RVGSVFVNNDALVFNDFIAEAGLMDLHIGGRRVSITAFPMVISDHCPLLLKVNISDFSPKPFKVLDYWLWILEFNEVVEVNWAVGMPYGPADVALKNKIKHLKTAIKSWHGDKSLKQKLKRVLLTYAISNWESKAEEGILTEADCIAREVALFKI
ncbi:hypothetical protein Tco_1544085, partial [Tanacetum coccineum]